MDILDVLKNRRSCRKFSSKEVEEGKIKKVIEAGLYAPSGKGKQAPIFIVITNNEMIKRLSRLNASIMGNPDVDPFYGAPCVIVVLSSKDVPTFVYDGSLSLGNMMNEAESIGLSSIWIHRAKEEFESAEGKQILKELGIEGDYEGIGHCCLGYGLDNPVCKSRNPNRVFYVR